MAHVCQPSRLKSLVLVYSYLLSASYMQIWCKELWSKNSCLRMARSMDWQ